MVDNDLGQDGDNGRDDYDPEAVDNVDDNAQHDCQDDQAQSHVDQSVHQDSPHSPIHGNHSIAESPTMSFTFTDYRYQRHSYHNQPRSSWAPRGISMPLVVIAALIIIPFLLAYGIKSWVNDTVISPKAHLLTVVMSALGVVRTHTPVPAMPSPNPILVPNARVKTIFHHPTHFTDMLGTTERIRDDLRHGPIPVPFWRRWWSGTKTGVHQATVINLLEEVWKHRNDSLTGFKGRLFQGKHGASILTDLGDATCAVSVDWHARELLAMSETEHETDVSVNEVDYLKALLDLSCEFATVASEDLNARLQNLERESRHMIAMIFRAKAVSQRDKFPRSEQADLELVKVLEEFAKAASGMYFVESDTS
ncbi:hypothetical protein FSARC_14995 [Fusarium sarcochroum]|uniref:Uncharacterized protein n=1 Tax=Fusarium sarcochroum TaxID=1208366 RepID=A0A8H4SPG7_9HYPO|nr:hypothetical protein FSARC_14995 [Fusarium sarcochroum]